MRPGLFSYDVVRCSYASARVSRAPACSDAKCRSRLPKGRLDPGFPAAPFDQLSTSIVFVLSSDDGGVIE